MNIKYGIFVVHSRTPPKNNPSRFARRGGPPPYGVRPPAPRSLRAVGSPTTNCDNRLIVQPQVGFVRTHVVGSGCRPERCSRAAHSPLRFWRCGRAVRKDGGITRENRRDGEITVVEIRSGDGVGGMFHLNEYNIWYIHRRTPPIAENGMRRGTSRAPSPTRTQFAALVCRNTGGFYPRCFCSAPSVKNTRLVSEPG